MPENTNTNQSEAVTDIQKPTLTFKVASRDKAGNIEEGQWKTKLTEVAPGLYDVEIYNIDPETGIEVFFKVVTTAPFGQPMVIQEPALGISLEGMEGVDPKKRIVGCIIIKNREVTDRFSLTNKIVKQKHEVAFDKKERILYVDGVAVGELQLLTDPDKNRLDGVVAYFAEGKIDSFEYRELQDMAMALLREMGAI